MSLMSSNKCSLLVYLLLCLANYIIFLMFLIKSSSKIPFPTVLSNITFPPVANAPNPAALPTDAYCFI